MMNEQNEMVGTVIEYDDAVLTEKGQMRVLIALPASDELSRASFLAMIAGDYRPLNAQELDIPPWIHLDVDYPPIGIGAIGGHLFEADAFSALTSRDFVVRCDIPEVQLEDVFSHFGEERVFSDPDIGAFAVCKEDPAIGATADVQANLAVINLWANGMDGNRTAIAILDSGINRTHLIARGVEAKIDPTVYWRRPGAATPDPGLHQIGHGTMCAYDAAIVAPGATLLDYPILGPGPLSSSQMGGALSNALSAYAHLLSWWAVAFGPSRNNYDALVLSNSWGMYHPDWDFRPGHPGRYLDNMSHPFNQIVASLSSANVDILFAAGNCGSYCPDPRCQGNATNSIMGANAHPQVICVGGVDVKGNWAGYSSEGPAVFGMDQNKPDIVAFTHFDGSRVYTGLPDSGTSAACPVAAGCVAALRTAIGQLSTPPAELASILESTARKSGQGVSWDRRLGCGIIDPVSAGRLVGAIP